MPRCNMALNRNVSGNGTFAARWKKQIVLNFLPLQLIMKQIPTLEVTTNYKSMTPLHGIFSFKN